MKSSCLAVATAVLALAGSARAADDTPPAPAAPAAPAAATKHENKITPEAKAAFEKMEKIGNNPVAHGLKDASGTIGMDMMGMAMSMKFTFKAPADVKVEADPNADGPMKMMGGQMARGMARMLKSMLGIFRPADEDEFDASLASKDGKDILTITTYTNNVEQGKSEFTLDSNGLIASGTSTTTMEMNGEKHDVTSETTFTYVKAGDVYRLDKMETAMTGGGGRRGGMGGGMGGGKITISLTYTEVEKFALATSWKTEMQGMQMVYESKISDLVVNGKKVEVQATEPVKKDKPKLGKGKGKGKGEKDEDGEDDGEDDEGGEKGGKK
jgi:hypothetical protein